MSSTMQMDISPEQMAALRAESQTWKIVVAIVIGFILATLGIALRLVSRWICKKNLELNDYLILVAYFPFGIAVNVASIMLGVYGLGKHLVTLSPETQTHYLQTLYVGSWTYTPCVGFTKLSILALYWAAFPFKYMRRSAIALAVIIIAWTLACVLVGLMGCLPIHKGWDLQTPGKCINYKSYYYGAQIPNIITDFAILLLPLKAVLDLRLPAGKTALMSGVFMIGLVTCIFDIVRLVSLVRLSTGTNVTWDQTDGAVWTQVEPTVGILVACLPVMRPLLSPMEFYRRAREGQQLEDSESVGGDVGFYGSNGSHELKNQLDVGGERDVTSSSFGDRSPVSPVKFN
ncbi:MAG: hypothetical protein M1831_005955 [Alyxoria varia]|nr:MAG: hypothetical protein M1831_005955 [Alyxoria varia]